MKRKQIYVDGLNGDDANPGTEAEPVKTMRRAELRREQQKIEDIMIVNPTDALRIESVMLNKERRFAEKVAVTKKLNGKGKGIVS